MTDPTLSSQARPVFDQPGFVMLTGGAPELQRQLAGLFLESLDQIADEVEAAAPAGGRTWGDALHRARSSACFVCARRLFDLLAGLERAAAGSSACERGAAAARVRAELEDLRAALREFVAAERGDGRLQAVDCSPARSQ